MSFNNYRKIIINSGNDFTLYFSGSGAPFTKLFPALGGSFDARINQSDIDTGSRGLIVTDSGSVNVDLENIRGYTTLKLDTPDAGGPYPTESYQVVYTEGDKILTGIQLDTGNTVQIPPTTTRIQISPFNTAVKLPVRAKDISTDDLVIRNVVSIEGGGDTGSLSKRINAFDGEGNIASPILLKQSGSLSDEDNFSISSGSGLTLLAGNNRTQFGKNIDWISPNENVGFKFFPGQEITNTPITEIYTLDDNQGADLVLNAQYYTESFDGGPFGSLPTVDTIQLQISGSSKLTVKKNEIDSSVTGSFPQLELRTLPQHSSEGTALVINDSDIVGTRELGSNAFNSNSYLRSDQSGTLTGDLTVTGKITAEEFHTEFVSASIIYQSGSTKFGDTSDDVHSFTGSIQQSGSNSYFLGNLGIGVTSNLGFYKFHVEGASYVSGSTLLSGNVDVVGDLRINDKLSHRNDTDTSIRFPFNDTITFETSNFERLRVTTFGNVGIGTTTPSEKLTISGSISSSGDVYIDGGIYDNNDTLGTPDQVLFTTSTGIEWRDNIAQEAEDLVITGKNLSGGTIAKGTPLYFTGSGTQGNVIGIYPSDAGNPNRMPAGGVAGESIADDEEGNVYIYGFISGVDTSQFNAGDDVFVGVGGGYTNQKPTGSALIQKLGNVEKVNQNNGSGVIQGPSWYNDLPNWEEGKIKVGRDDGQPVTSSVIHLDETNGRLGINTTTPGGIIDVWGDEESNSIFKITGSPNNSDDLIQLGDVDDVGNAQLFTIDGSTPKFTFVGGNIGIGTNSPSQPLTVEGNISGSGNLDIEGNSTIEGNIINSVVTLTTFSGNLNDYDIGSGSVFTIQTSTSTIPGSEITGLANGVDGRYVEIINRGINDITFRNDSVSSSAENRIYVPRSQDVVVDQWNSIKLRYLGGTVNKWIAI